jgi:MFS family permease
VLVYAGVFAVSCTSQFFNPARFATIGAVVHPDDQPRAGGLSQATAAMAGIVGPPLAAPLLFSVGVQWALAVNAASFLISYAAVSAIRVGAGASSTDSAPDSASAPRRRSFGREYAEGLRFFARNPVLQTIGISVIIVMLGVGALNALDVFFVTENLHADASLLGTLAAAFGVGSVVGALLAGAIGGRVGIGRLYWIGLLLMGLAMIGYSRTTALAPAFALLFLAGVPVAIVNSVVGPILLRVTPAHLLGRIISLLTPLTQVAAILSMAAAGFLASTTLRDLHFTVAGVSFGRIDTIFLAGGLLTVAGALWAALRLREVDRPAPDPALDPAPDAEPARLRANP